MLKYHIIRYIKANIKSISAFSSTKSNIKNKIKLFSLSSVNSFNILALGIYFGIFTKIQLKYVIKL